MGVSDSMDPRRGLPCLGFAFLLFLGACSSEPSTPAPPPTLTPANLAVTYLAPNRVLLTWTEPTAQYDGTRVEYGTPGGTFRQLSDLVPAGQSRVLLETQTDLPELLVLIFQLTSIREGSPIGPSATVQFTEPLRALSVSATLVGSTIQVQWSTTSAVADRVELRREHYRDPSTVVEDPSAAATYPLSQTSRVDNDILEAMTYVYTLTLKAGQVSSTPTGAEVATYPAPPTDLVARAHAGTVELTWTNHSQAATEIQVLRGQGLQPGGNVDIVAHLAPDAGVYREQVPGPGQYTYTISAQVPVYGTAFVWASVDVLPPSVPFQTEIQSPGGSPLSAILHPSGEWLLCGSTPAVDPLPQGALDAGTAIPGTRFVGDSWATPCLMIDGSGRPHSVFSAAGTVYHAWFDGSAWEMEEIAARPFGVGYLRAGLDSRDALHVVWLQAGLSPDTGFEYLHRADAGWVTESLPDIAFPQDATPLHLAVDRADTVHVLWAPRLDHLRRSGAGIWTLEQIPVALANGERIADSVFLPNLSTGPVVLFSRVPSTLDRHSIELSTWDAGRWSVPELVTSFQGDGSWLIATASADGTRLAASIAQGPRTVFLRGDAGWTSLDLGAMSPAWVLGLALDEQDRVHWLESSFVYQRFERFDETP